MNTDYEIIITVFAIIGIIYGIGAVFNILGWVALLMFLELAGMSFVVLIFKLRDMMYGSD